MPPISITNDILNLSVFIAEILGSLDALHFERPEISLRKDNRIQTIQSSLAIEGNTLSLEQVTDLINNVPIIGPKKDIQEVKNAIVAYDAINQYKFQSSASLKKAHHLLMQELINDAGTFRAGNVGIFAGNKVAHVAPPAKRVPKLMNDLFDFLKSKDKLSLLIKACIFHYELEFIHPFSDGNGRIGRLWQQVILMQYHPAFEFLSIESLIKTKQREYYDVLGQCDSNGESTLFVEFILQLIYEALLDYQSMIKYIPNTRQSRINSAANRFNDHWFSRQDYMQLHKTISPATASRDLNYAVSEKIIVRQGDKRLAKYRFKD